MIDVAESYLSELLRRLKIPPAQRDQLLKKFAESLELPQFFAELDAAIQESKTRILSLAEDWDGEGAKLYLEDSWLRAVDFLRKVAEKLWIDTGLQFNLPEILPGPQGSIDLHWKSPKFELLINFPEDPTEPTDVYGDNYEERVLKGTFEVEELLGVIAAWLKNYL